MIEDPVGRPDRADMVRDCVSRWEAMLQVPTRSQLAGPRSHKRSHNIRA